MPVASTKTARPVRAPPKMDIARNSALILAIDLPWLYLIGPWASNVVRGIQGTSLEMRAWPALPVYLALGYLLSLAKSAEQAFAVGLATYAVYDFTLMAIFKEYPLEFAVADSLWGGTLMWIAFGLKEYLRF